MNLCVGFGGCVVDILPHFKLTFCLVYCSCSFRLSPSGSVSLSLPSHSKSWARGIWAYQLLWWLHTTHQMEDLCFICCHTTNSCWSIHLLHHFSLSLPMYQIYPHRNLMCVHMYTKVASSPGHSQLSTFTRKAREPGTPQWDSWLPAKQWESTNTEKAINQKISVFIHRHQ